ncbi:hypothetical protein HTZ77_24100 [Nonomuraea sp. SMC257]|uniref:Uncharacterized protein n=1 Tax=Nonomuraea montanisoli TaxID=2741721 RepID=A0A7Y6IA72_9ACTN|nr:hypothetical protein [Nonomuraea montanisoli]NUW34499.1 hypothetical protein [Nonomuraea montanisoli]
MGNRCTSEFWGRWKSGTPTGPACGSAGRVRGRCRRAATAALGHPRECRALYRELLPCSGRISVLSAVLCAGPVDWYLALPASAAGRRELAEEHLATLREPAGAAGLTWWHDRAASAGPPVHPSLRLVRNG